MKLSRSRRRDFEPAQWRPVAPGVRARVYPSAAAYRKHQASKLQTLSPERLAEYHGTLRSALVDRLAPIDLEWGAVLCLGARSGAEVEAFHAVGCRSAVGIDLAPASPLVIQGDFHSIGFASGGFETVFTNSLDHVLSLERVLAEVHRVLRPGGVFVLEASMKPPAEYESLAWDSIDDLVAVIAPAGFRLMAEAPFGVPWKGTQLLLVRV